MNNDQILAQTINDIDDFVVRLSNNIDEDALAELENFKFQIKSNIGNENSQTQDICKKAIQFMQTFELNLLENQKNKDESKLLQDLLSQSVNISNNSSIIDNKIVTNKANRFKNIYYKYFYKGEVVEKDFDNDKFIYDFFDNAYRLLIWTIIIMILLFFIKSYFGQNIIQYYQIFVLGWFGLGISLCINTKTNTNMSFIIDLFIVGCFASGFRLIKLYFAL